MYCLYIYICIYKTCYFCEFIVLNCCKPLVAVFFSFYLLLTEWVHRDLMVQNKKHTLHFLISIPLTHTHTLQYLQSHLISLLWTDTTISPSLTHPSYALACLTDTWLSHAVTVTIAIIFLRIPVDILAILINESWTVRIDRTAIFVHWLPITDEAEVRLRPGIRLVIGTVTKTRGSL